MPEKKKTRISLIEDICDYIRDISLPERAMLNTLARYANPDGSNVYPGQKLLMAILGIKEREVKYLFSSLKKKGYLILDGKHGYSNKYRLNIPTMPVISQDISKEEWEAMMIPDDDDQEQTDKRPAVRPPDNDATVKVPTVKPPATVPTTPPVSAEEEYQKKLDHIWYCICREREKKVGVSYERILKEAQRTEVARDDVDWLWEEYERDVGGEDDSRLGSQPSEPSTTITTISEGTYPLGNH